MPGAGGRVCASRQGWASWAHRNTIKCEAGHHITYANANHDFPQLGCCVQLGDSLLLGSANREYSLREQNQRSERCPLLRGGRAVHAPRLFPTKLDPLPAPLRRQPRKAGHDGAAMRLTAYGGTSAIHGPLPDEWERRTRTRPAGPLGAEDTEAGFDCVTGDGSGAPLLDPTTDPQPRGRPAPKDVDVEGRPNGAGNA